MSGIAVDLRNFKPSMVSIDDIARGLGQTCRFNGQVRHRFSVIEHSLIGAALADTPELSLEALLHDAGEAYTGDIILPMKECFPEIADFEDGITAVIFEVLYPDSGCIKNGKYVKSEWMSVLDVAMARWESLYLRPHLAFEHQTWQTRDVWIREFRKLPLQRDDLHEKFVEEYHRLSALVAARSGTPIAEYPQCVYL
jgi:hypothetical protein